MQLSGEFVIIDLTRPFISLPILKKGKQKYDEIRSRLNLVIFASNCLEPMHGLNAE